MLGRTLLRPRLLSVRHVSRRNFSFETLGPAFLDLAIALPYPESIPVYSTTIILATVLIRVGLWSTVTQGWTIPRRRRLEKHVFPELRAMIPDIRKLVIKQMIAEGVKGEKEFLTREINTRCMVEADTRRKTLMKKYRCNPRMTSVVQWAAHLPPFVIFSYFLRDLCIHPFYPLDSESFFTLTSLTHADPVWLPLIVGFLSLANVEIGSAEYLRRGESAEKKTKSFQVNTITTNAARLFAIGRICLTAMAPGAIQIYWVTSAAIALLQAWLTEWQDTVWRRKHGLNHPLLPPPPPPPPPSLKAPEEKPEPAVQRHRRNIPGVLALDALKAKQKNKQ